MPERRAPGAYGWVIGLYGLHSCVSLVYEVVWLRLLAAQFGRTLAAMGLVIAVYMAGLGIGAALIAAWSRRRVLPVRRVFVGAQLGLGLGGVSFSGLLSWIDQLYTTLNLPAEPLVYMGLQMAMSAFPLLVLGAISGMIFPLLSACSTTAVPYRTGLRLGSLYWIGLIGASSGALMAPLVLIPTLGYAGTGLLLGLLSVVSALGGRYLLDAASYNLAEVSRPALPHAPLSMRAICLLSFGIGVCFFAVAHIAATYLWLIVDATVYAEGILLGTTLLCMGAGALAYLLLRRMTVALNTLLVGGLLLIAASQLAWLGLAAHMARAFEVILQGSAWLPFSGLRFFSAQSVLVIMAVGLPAMAAGLVLTTLYDLSSRYGGGANPIGRVTAWHYGGAIVGAAGTAFGLIPTLGMSLSLTIMSAAAVLMATASIPKSPQLKLRPVFVWGAGAVLSMIVFALGAMGDLTFREQAAGSQHDVVWWHEDGAGVVEVYRERQTGYQTLRSSRLRQEGGDRPTDLRVERLQGALPVLLHPNPARVLVVGLGTGISVAASLRPEVGQLTCVELSQGVINAAARFSHANHDVLAHANLNLVHEDGRTFIKRSRHTYDLIVQDLFFPYRSGAGSLYTREHYERLRARLSPQGRAAQWIAINQLGPLELRSLIRTFSSVFPETSLWLTGGYLMLYGGFEPLRASWSTWHRRMMAQPPIDGADSADMLSMFIASGESIRRWTATAPLNTDDNALIEFRAPRAFEALNSVDLAVENLSSLLTLHQDVSQLFDDMPPTGHLTRIAQASKALLEGIIARAQGDLDHARERYEYAYDLNPVNYQVRRFLQEDLAARGRQAHLERRYTEAEALLQRALDINAELPDARFDLALIATKREDHRAAVAHLHALLQHHPNFPHAQFNLGVNLYHLGRYEEATQQFSRVLDDTPESVDARFNLANSLAQAGQYDGAVEQYQQTLRLDPMHQQARNNLNEIESWQRRQRASQ